MVLDVMQDKEGFMWFATKDGLNRYDGYQVTVYKNNVQDAYSLPENHITQLLEDEFGNFWVGTLKNGVYLFDKKKERFYAFNGIKTFVNRIDFNHQRLLIQYANNLMLYEIKHKINDYSVTSISNTCSEILNYNKEQVNPKLRIDYNTEIYDSKLFADGSIWFASTETIFQWKYTASQQKWAEVTYTCADLKLGANCFQNSQLLNMELYLNKVFILQNQHYYEFDILKKKITYKQDLVEKFTSTEIQFSALTSNEIHVFINLVPHLLNVETHSFRPLYDNGEGTLQRSMTHPFLDRNDILWHPSKGWGIYKTDLRKQRFKTIPKIGNQNAFHTTLKVCQPFMDTLKNFPTADIQLTYHSSCKDQQSNYWFCPYQASNQRLYLVKYNLKTHRITEFPTIRQGYSGAVLYCDPKNQLWIFETVDPTHTYIYKINAETGMIAKKYLIPLPRNYGDEGVVSQACMDDLKRLWLVTTLGLVRFDTKTEKFETWNQQKNSILSKDLYCIENDPVQPQKKMWIGSNGYGLIEFNLIDEKIKIYNENHGLSNSVIYRLAVGIDHNLWFSTNKGITCFNPNTHVVQNFTQEDGLPGDEFNRHEMLKLNKGNLLFGGMEGSVFFSPGEVTKRQAAVPMAFTELSFSGTAVNWKSAKDVLLAPINFADKIILNPQQNNFTIKFATLEFRSRANKLYKYRLLGFNDEWSAPSPKNEATFTNLSPGIYTLHVAGTNSDGVWNTQGIKIQIQVLPAWYQTWLFRILVFLFLGVTLYLLYRYRLHQQLKVLQVRNRIASDLHDELGSTLSSISMYSEAASKMHIDNTQVKLVLEKINQNTMQVLESMSDIVWAVNTKNDQLHNIINRMRNFGIGLSEARDFQFTITENSQLPDIAIDLNQRKNLYLIFKEAVNNAAKYAHCTKISTVIQIEKNDLIMEIIDDGVGFDPRQLQNEKEGNGLYNMRKRAQDLGGNFNINSAPEMGTKIFLQVPLRK